MNHDWNNGFGLGPGDVVRDEEGLNTTKNLGRNMAWLLKSIEKTDLAPSTTTMLSEYRSLTSEKEALKIDHTTPPSTR